VVQPIPAVVQPVPVPAVVQPVPVPAVVQPFVPAVSQGSGYLQPSDRQQPFPGEAGEESQESFTQEGSAEDAEDADEDNEYRLDDEEADEDEKDAEDDDEMMVMMMMEMQGGSQDAGLTLVRHDETKESSEEEESNGSQEHSVDSSLAQVSDKSSAKFAAGPVLQPLNQPMQPIQPGFLGEPARLPPPPPGPSYDAPSVEPIEGNVIATNSYRGQGDQVMQSQTVSYPQYPQPLQPQLPIAPYGAYSMPPQANRILRL